METWFDVPCSRIEEVPENVTLPRNNTSAGEDFSDDKLIKVHATKHSQVKERKRYSQKLAKQLQSIGVNVDIETGLEQKQPSETSSDFEGSEEGQAIDSPLESVQDTRPKRLFTNLADETLLALEGSSAGGMDTTLADELEGWDPMKESYEQKSFNSYGPQKYDDNFMEKHTFNTTPDGKKQISPAKQGAEDLTLYIQNIPYSLTEDGLRNMFSSIGRCWNIKKQRMRDGEKTTYGFVTYGTVKEAEAAIKKFDDFPFGNDIKLRVRLSRGKKPASSEELRWGKNQIVESIESDNYDDIPEVKGSNEIVNGGILKKRANKNLDETDSYAEPRDESTYASQTIKQEEASPTRPVNNTSNLNSTEKTVNEEKAQLSQKTADVEVKSRKVDSTSFLEKFEQRQESPSVPSAMKTEKKLSNSILAAASIAATNNILCDPPLTQKLNAASVPSSSQAEKDPINLPTSSIAAAKNISPVPPVTQKLNAPPVPSANRVEKDSNNLPTSSIAATNNISPVPLVTQKLNAPSVPSANRVEKDSNNLPTSSIAATNNISPVPLIPQKQKVQENYSDFGEIVAKEMQALAAKYSDEALDDLKLQILGTIERFKSAKKTRNSRTQNLLKALGNSP